MAIIASFDTTTLEGLVTTLSARETTLDAAIAAQALAQTAENSAEAALGGGVGGVSHAVEVLNAPLGEGYVAERLQRTTNMQNAVAASGTTALTAASAAVGVAAAAVIVAQTNKNLALTALTGYIATIV